MKLRLLFSALVILWLGSSVLVDLVLPRMSRYDAPQPSAMYTAAVVK